MDSNVFFLGENEQGRSPIFVLQTVASFYSNLPTTIGCAQVFCKIYDREQIVTASVPSSY